jgi:ketosteroid isomerase-like protein
MGPEKSCVRRRAAAAILLASLLAASVSAQLQPLPSRVIRQDLIEIFEHEHLFAVYSGAYGMKEAFLRFAAPDAVIFRGGPVNAIEAWTQTNPAPTGLLLWFPTYGEVSRAGDLGWTTGPYEFREKRDDKEAAGHGHYVTLWRRQPDGHWKFVLDFGIRHEAPLNREAALQDVPDSPVARPRSKGVANAEAARSSLLEAERALSNDSTMNGSARALLSRADESFRLYRQNTFPVVGRKAARKALGGRTDVVAWRPTKAEVARSGDLGYCYGTYEVRSKPADEKPSEQGNYVRIWKRQGGAWRVVLDVTSAVRPR